MKSTIIMRNHRHSRLSPPSEMENRAWHATARLLLRIDGVKHQASAETHPGGHPAVTRAKHEGFVPETEVARCPCSSFGIGGGTMDATPTPKEVLDIYITVLSMRSAFAEALPKAALSNGGALEPLVGAREDDEIADCEFTSQSPYTADSKIVRARIPEIRPASPRFQDSLLD